MGVCHFFSHFLSTLRLLVKDARELAAWFKKTYPLWVNGNHEVEPVKDFEKGYFHIFSLKPTEFAMMEYNDTPVNILLCHGDFITRGESYARIFRRKKAGASKHKRFWLTVKNKLRKLKSKGRAKLSLKVRQRAEFYLNKYDCKELWIGHKHPGELTEIRFKGLKIVVFPQGITEYKGYTVMSDLHLYGCHGDLV